MTIPEGQKDQLLDQMLESIQSVTNNRDRFFEEFTDVKIPSIYTYEPPKHHDEYYPEIGYSYHAPKTDHFFLNDRYGSYYGYRFTFYGRYDTEIEMPIPKLEIRSARIEDESFSENQINNQEPDGYMGYEDKFAYAVSDLMLDDTVDTGIFTTAKKVLFDGYNVYWFVTEVDGFIYSINFNIAEDAPGEILDTFLNDVVATFELKEG
ncbi:hypothetical protein [Alkalicoccobacillus plakortidis]|uniref:Uncharacterized protein n=1 Tax=Alkalicoccobacillus plakortidis TaxID=444060 RepID=A0ABT0XNQ7_9BACI|nr:hypothetical protein [Alkalicoccobacillus plakortidis]MCM2677543.1 hypothetical protein [Alkalicoccobacillus plakortidis]